jgi:hypothetical protein
MAKVYYTYKFNLTLLPDTQPTLTINMDMIVALWPKFMYDNSWDIKIETRAYTFMSKLVQLK